MCFYFYLFLFALFFHLLRVLYTSFTDYVIKRPILFAWRGLTRKYSHSEYYGGNDDGQPAVPIKLSKTNTENFNKENEMMGATHSTQNYMWMEKKKYNVSLSSSSIFFLYFYLFSRAIKKLFFWSWPQWNNETLSGWKEFSQVEKKKGNPIWFTFTFSQNRCVCCIC